MKVLVTGSEGFIGSYLCSELLKHDYQVCGIDNFSKYGEVIHVHDRHDNFTFVRGNAINLAELCDTVHPDFVIAGAAMIGGIGYFHKYAYDLLATNERITASTFDYALDEFQHHNLQRIIVLSSSMVYESTKTYPTPESNICPPPQSTYGFQKLACEYFCKGAYEQYGLPYTIIRPFNCIGVGEVDAIGEENIMFTMSHVVPDLIRKSIQVGKNGSLPILGSGNQIRHYTYGGDIARGIRLAMESDKAINEDFNISSDRQVTVLELADLIWRKLYGDTVLAIQHCESYPYDVQIRSPSTEKAKDVLGFECETNLEDALDIVIDWVRKQWPNLK